MVTVQVTQAAADYIEMYRNPDTLREAKATICDLMSEFIFEEQTSNDNEARRYLIVLSDFVDLINVLSDTPTGNDTESEEN